MTATEAGALGKYRLIAELGRGGMADVYLALMRGPGGFNKLVVIKRIREQLADDPHFVTMFLDEARLAARLNHPNVVQTNEIGGGARQLFITMEYLEGQPLNRVAARLWREGSLTWPMYLRIVIEALNGLHYAHELCDFDGTRLHVVHRDMTPHNVFVTYSGQVKVVDFGIAKAIDSEETRTGMLKGKAAYMSPEQAQGDPVDRRADIFSVGVMIWEGLVGRRLFREDNDIAILHKITSRVIPDPRSINADVPDGLASICMKALAPEPAERHATAAELQAELEDALERAGEWPSLRGLGQLIAEYFERERMQIGAVVEAQVSALRAAGEAASVGPPLAQLDESLLRKLPVLNVVRISESGPGPSEVPSRRTPSSGKPSGGTPEGMKAETPLTASAANSGGARRASQRLLSEPLSRTSRRMLGLAVFGVAALLGGTFAWLRTRPVASPARTELPAAASGHGTRRLHIESTPSGATVSERETLLGTTPLTLALDPGETSVRRFVVASPGYVPYTLEYSPRQEGQGSTKGASGPEDVRVVVPLLRAESASSSAESPAPAASANARAGPSAASGRGRGVKTQRPPPHPGGAPPLPINMSR